MSVRFRALSFPLMLLAALALGAVPAWSQEEDGVAAVRKSSEKVVAAFNAGNVDELVGAFLPRGELITEAGVVYQGPAELKELFAGFFEQFPGAKLALEIESIRVVGPIAIEEGTRTISVADGTERSRFHYLGVWTKGEQGWQLASFRDFADDPAPTPADHLAPLAFLIGDWINEGADGKVAIHYRWSDDKNYLLGDFEFSSTDGITRKSTQRVGWDPSTGRLRSWLFDADGGFAEGFWSVVADGVLIRSASVNPDGTTASATLFLSQEDKDHYTIEGTDRIVGGIEQEDFELTVTRRPPAAGK